MADQENQQQQGEESGKVAKKYDDNIKKLTALLGGAGALKKTKVPNDTIGGLVTELLQEDQETAGKVLKEKIKGLITKYVAFNKEANKLQKELEGKISAGKKDFNAAVQEVFNEIENIGAIEQNYYNTLRAATENVPTAETPAVEPKPEN